MAESDGEEPQGRPTTLTFVNAHLAAFDEMFEKRNTDFHDLSKRLVFEPVISVVEEQLPGNGSWYTRAATPLSIFDSDALFWLVSTNWLFCVTPRGCRRGADASWLLGWCIGCRAVSVIISDTLMRWKSGVFGRTNLLWCRLEL